MPRVGLEPTHSEEYWSFNPACLPISPPRQLQKKSQKINISFKWNFSIKNNLQNSKASTENKIAWKVFRDVLNDFYKKRKLFYKNKKSEENQIINKKILLCKEAESLQESTDWDITTKKMINLQKKWKSSGYSSRDKTNKIWRI